jgi:predicted ATPase
MRIVSFRIENFRNLRLAECAEVPNFMVICGGNGCGKSALLEALMTAKEHSGAYGSFPFDPKAVSADASTAIISMEVQFSPAEQEFVRTTYRESCPERDEVVIEIATGGEVRALKRSTPVYRLFSYYSQARGSPGYFDYITAHRQTNKTTLQTWDSSALSDQLAKQTLALGQQKFQYTKQYLAGLKMRDLQAVQTAIREGTALPNDSLAEVRKFFDRFFAPMHFKDVLLDQAPFGFVVSTPRGEIDIDDLSSGEKEILNIFIRFHQLKPQGAVILFDEADAHLHPDLERRYLQELRSLTEGSQLILTTHSPEMMIAAGSESLYTILKHPGPVAQNQLQRVTEDAHLYEVLAEMMGSRGLVSFNQRIVFIEGEEASADRAIFEAFYPPAQYNLSFVPAGNSATVRKTADQVNALLSASVGFQQYFSIVDRDIGRSSEDPTAGSRLFRLPVYHVENLLLDDNAILTATKAMLGHDCPYKTAAEVAVELKRLLLSDEHRKPFARAILDAKLAKLAQLAYDAVYRDGVSRPGLAPRPDFASAESEARALLTASIAAGTWRADCKGRDLLRAFCGQHAMKYDHFRNSVIATIGVPPPELQGIMRRILDA